jgi:hypothetical protein
MLFVLHNLVEAETNAEIIRTVRPLQESSERDLCIFGSFNAHAMQRQVPKHTQTKTVRKCTVQDLNLQPSD